MRKLASLSFLLVISCSVYSQKKPLDHTVYDGWQAIGERMISNDGKWIVYSITPQEGDNELVVQSPYGIYKKSVPRGYGAVITDDSRYVIFKIRPFFKETRDARIKKKRPDDMPKDSIGIIELGKDSIWKLARVKTFKAPQEEAGWMAYHLDKPVEKKETPERPRRTESPDKKITDSLTRVIDSLYAVIESIPKKEKKKKSKDENKSISSPDMEESYADAEGDETPAAPVDAGTDLVVRSLADGKEKIFNNVLEYYFSKKGNKLVLEQAKNPKDSLSKPTVLLYDLKLAKSTVLSRGGNDFKNFAFSEDGDQLAYVAERDAKPKELQKFYKLWYYKAGMDSAIMLADKNSVGMKLGMTVSEFGNLSFSKAGKRLFFGTAPIQAPRDTTLVDIDLVKLDVWHYNDDYLQTQQLFRLPRDLQANYLAVYHFDNNTIKQLATPELPLVYPTNEGDGAQFVGITDFGRRVESQWAGNTKKDIYVIDPVSGDQQLVKKDMLGVLTQQYISPTGKYIMWYDSKVKHYFMWDGDSIKNVSAKIKLPLWNEEHDSPSDPPPYGVMGWQQGDSAVYVYDKYDIWKINIAVKKAPYNFLDTRGGRKSKIVTRYVRTDPEERFITENNGLLVRRFDDNNKTSDYSIFYPHQSQFMLNDRLQSYSFGAPVKAKNSDVLIFTKETYRLSPDLYVVSDTSAINDLSGAKIPVLQVNKLTSINPQQKEYNWGTAELYKWKAFNGKESAGILYKPEDFDPNKKYPMIMYFYETHSNDLYDYIPPTPTGSRLNISFFVSRGYLVFSPDIHYTIGKPAKSAYDYVVSAAKDLSKHKWVDAQNIGIQGQSWGGIQVAQLVTMTDMFKAAWAGAPVANMTSAYGGIRWESGANRQFQYEKTQSRIGATLWNYT
jgi:hypothetical protein